MASLLVYEVGKVKKVEENNIDLSENFNGINGCCVVFNLKENQYLFYNKALANKRVSPYSTFKIVSTLIGLQNKIIEDQDSTMHYNNIKYPVETWNQNLTLKDAFQSSCIWFFKQVIDAVGQNEVKAEIDQLSYGNCDVSEWNGSNVNLFDDLNGFWLNSSLKISPFEQVQLLTKIFEGHTFYSNEYIEILKNLMKDDHNQQIYGKTGAGPNGIAWFIGFLEQKHKKIYIAVYLDDNTRNYISGSLAKDIAFKILKD